LSRGLRLIGVSREEVWNIVAATRLSKLADVGAEVKKREGRDAWYVKATTDMLAAGRKEFRDAIAEIVKTARGNGWTDADKAEGWLEELEERGHAFKGAGRSTRGMCVAARLRSVSPPQAPAT
jgi:predicted Zn-dependent protease